MIEEDCPSFPCHFTTMSVPIVLTRQHASQRAFVQAQDGGQLCCVVMYRHGMVVVARHKE